MTNIPVVIPSYLPDERLLELIDNLTALGVQSIIVVRDGGGNEYDFIYEKIANNEKCILVIHEQNQGKGRAIKTGIKTYLEKGFTGGFVLADADGQHLPADILNVINALKENEDALIIGSRSFDKDVPMRSKFGNIVSRYIFSYSLGRQISDTQSGLRGMPHKHLERFLELEGEKYEFETNVLIETRKSDIEIKEVPISTVYIENNRSSHFNPLVDSLKIYWLILKYSMSSLVSFLVDYWLFLFLHFFTQGILIPSYVARAVSLGINYQANKNIVFRYKGKSKFLFLKYLALVLFSITVSYLAVSYLVSIHVKIWWAKLFVEIALFFFNFYVQKRYIFKK
ncbi:MAG: bifunctional glycosyltransferase family 2/GtrA family protein [Alphaproteobacteria bacterium]|jgi:glycosyltransferase involved in cell wall biosynthesis|nr:bifunctional glycosyltransferase family 2/GtrA family protein [Alphaproteobacteria bacterium]